MVLLVVFSTACLLPVTNQADGAGCQSDDECKSHRCVQGYCGGSTCKRNDSSSCDDGWKCVHSDPDPITAFFGADGSDRCRPTCGHCPGNSHCAKGGVEGETICSFGKAPLELTIEATRVIAGQPARIVAVATPPAGRLVKCEWDPGDGKAREETTGPELTHTFDSGRRQFRVHASCTDDGGRTGSSEVLADVGCQASEGACAPSACCAEQGFHCLASLSGAGNVCRAPRPPALTVTGPTTIPVYTSGDYTASIAGGEGTLGSVTWSFSDSSSSRSGITVSHSFSDVGAATVRAKAMTSLGQNIEQSYAVTVCQLQNGRCSDTEPCCAPLTCKAEGSSTMRCLP
jgi:hypothetical protein